MNLDGILRYLKESYDPHTIISFGSVARGTYTPESDFDVVVISDTAKLGTDTAEIDGVLLDAFIYNTRDVLETTPTELLQIYESKLLLDEKGLGIWLKNNVRQYVQNRQKKTREEKNYLRSRMRKQLRRSEQGGAQGLYRLCWILKDSLDTYFSLRDELYYGPDDALERMQKNAPNDYALYEAAMREPTLAHCRAWVNVMLDGGKRRPTER